VETASLPSRERRLGLLAGYLLLLVALVAGSELRRVGDGREYLDMMQDLLRFETPSRYVHFWFYSALAAPFLSFVQMTSFDPYAAFVPLNFALLAWAFWTASGVLNPIALLLVFVSPIVWWTDKAHTEVFTFALLTIAIVSLRPRTDDRALHPGWAVVCLAAAGTQNPPFIALVPIAILLLLVTRITRLGDRRFVGLSIGALLLAALHPAYYYFTQGRTSGLAGSTHGEIPNIDEFLAVVRDSGLGLIPNAPLFAIAAVAVLVFVIVRAPRRLIAPDLIFAFVAGTLFLVGFSQTANFNHGATPGMSRYALWLIPLLVPFLRVVGDVRPTGGFSTAVTVMAIGSAVWSMVFFHPVRPDSSRPSVLASLIWTHFPWLDRPLPEVFIERQRPPSGPLVLPVSTPQCTKLLFMGRGVNDAVWPIPCFPTAVPPECRGGRTLCYANRRGTDYEFEVVPRPTIWNFRYEPLFAWTIEESRTARSLLTRLRWWELPLCNISVNRVTLGAYGVGGSNYYCGRDRLFAYFKNREGARIRMRLRMAMSGALIDATTGQTLSLVTYGVRPGEIWDLPIPPGPASVILVMTASGTL
jgi:hypothetical protein